MLFDSYLFSSPINIAIVLAAFFIDVRFRNALAIYTTCLVLILFRAVCWVLYSDAMSVITDEDNIFLQQSVINYVVWATVGIILSRLFIWGFRVPTYMPGTKSKFVVQKIKNNSLVYNTCPATSASAFFYAQDGEESTSMHDLNKRIFLKYMLGLSLFLIPLMFIEFTIPCGFMEISGLLFVLVICLVATGIDWWSNRTTQSTVVEMENRVKSFEIRYETEFLWDNCDNYTEIYLGIALMIIILIVPCWIFPGLLGTLYCFIILIPLTVMCLAYHLYRANSESKVEK